MSNRALRLITNGLYLVPWRVAQYQRRVPGIKVVAAGSAKGRQFRQAVPVQREMGWVTAKRGALILSERELCCGEWQIPLADIQAASLQPMAGGMVLKVTTASGLYYQFGLSSDPAWQRQTVLPLEIEPRRELAFSKLSAGLRGLAWVFLSISLIRGVLVQEAVLYLLLLAFVWLWISRQLLSAVQQWRQKT
ncbi:MAG: hypothetical protein HC812_06690 [Leptolyngbya sp. RL_3_1]|nr:hypothetical protein [Leptolyngbya sp. RL_3_1]